MCVICDGVFVALYVCGDNELCVEERGKER